MALPVLCYNNNFGRLCDCITSGLELGAYGSTHELGPGLFGSDLDLGCSCGILDRSDLTTPGRTDQFS